MQSQLYNYDSKQTNVQDTSVEAYRDSKQLRETQKHRVENFILSHPEGVCDLMIHESTGVPVHLVPARRADCINDGSVFGYPVETKKYKGLRRKFWAPICGGVR